MQQTDCRKVKLFLALKKVSLYIPTVVMPHSFITFRNSSLNSRSMASVMLLHLMTRTGTAYGLKLRSSSLIMNSSKWEAASLFLVVTPLMHGSSSFFSAETSAWIFPLPWTGPFILAKVSLIPSVIVVLFSINLE